MKKHLITGMIILLPLVLTIAVIAFIVDFLTKPFMGFVLNFFDQNNLANKGFLIFSPEQMIMHISQLIILICIFLTILCLGIVARWFLINWLITIGENILHKIPLINKIYKTTKDIIVNMFGKGKNSFKQVVMVPFPDNGIYALGLLSGKAPNICSKNRSTNLTSVFIPTAPNPATGFVVMYKDSDIILIDMKVEDAIKYILSCGLFAPPEKENREK